MSVASLMATRDLGPEAVERFVEIVSAGTYQSDPCCRSTRACGASFQFYCGRHDIYGPVRATKAEADRDECLVLVARLTSHEHWKLGLIERLHAEQGSGSARALSSEIAHEDSGEPAPAEPRSTDAAWDELEAKAQAVLKRDAFHIRVTTLRECEAFSHFTGPTRSSLNLCDADPTDQDMTFHDAQVLNQRAGLESSGVCIACLAIFRRNTR